MRKFLTVLLAIVAIGCIAGALYYPIQYQIQKKANDNNMNDLRALRAAGLQSAQQAQTETGDSAPAAQDTPSDAVFVDGGSLQAEPDAASGTAEGIAESAGSPSAADGGTASRESAAGAEHATSDPASGENPSAAAPSGGYSGAPAGGRASGRRTNANPQASGEAASNAPAATDETAADGGAASVREPAESSGDSSADAAPAESAAGSDAEQQGVMPWLARSLKDMGVEQVEDVPVAREAEEEAEVVTEDEVLIDEFGNEYWLDSDAIPYYLKPRRFLNPAQILPQYREIYDRNHDFVGWLSIPDTIIDYPVMQSVVNDYYLKRDFYGSYNANGELILDNQCDPYTPSYNLIISGHNMRSGAKFGNMAEFDSYDYWRTHKLLKFDTLMTEGDYVIVAAFRSAVYTSDAQGFRYMTIFEDEPEFEKWIAKVHSNQLYDTHVDCAFGDQFITLSTCAYHQTNGRFVVVARKIREGETFESDPIEPEGTPAPEDSDA